MSQERARSAKSLARIMAIAGLTVLTCAQAAYAQHDDQPPSRGPAAVAELSVIAGTLHLYGCTVSADAIELRALPLTAAVTSAGERQARVGRVAELRTRLQPTRTPHVYGFSFRGVLPGAPYRLQVRLRPLDACGTVIWRAPLDGIVFGGGRRVALEGFAVTTTVEVRDADGDWVRADELRLDDPTGGVRIFRWRSVLPGVVGGELKVSLIPFPMDPLPLPCGEFDTGVVHRERLTLNGGERAQVVSLDLGTMLDERRLDGPGATALRPFLVGAPLYVRVVPELPEGLGCDPEQHGIPGATALAKIPGGSLPPTEPPPQLPPVIPGNGHSYSPPYVGTPAEGHPTYNELAYKVIRKHTLPPANCATGSQTEIVFWLLTDPLGCHLIDQGATPGATVQPGDWFFFTPASKSSGSSDPFSSFGSALGNLGEAFYSGAGLAVSGLSSAWADIQETVAKVVVDVVTWVPGIEAACDALAAKGPDCDSIVKAGIQAGLMAMGIPPSIPNWEQLQQEGIDYLAAEMATQIEASTGVPSTLSEVALKELAKTALEKIEATRGAGPGPAYDWVIPYLGFEPAVLKVTLRETGTPIPAGLTLNKDRDFLYSGAEFPVPKVFPTSTMLRVPTVLQPRLDVFEAPVCRSFGNSVTCEPGSLFGQPLKTPQCLYYDLSQDKWINYGCGSRNWPAIYYRDRWRAERFSQSACARLKASMLLAGVFGIPLWSPEHSFTMTAWVKPPEFAVWDGADFSACGI